MGTIFATTYANLTMGYPETKDYSVIRESYTPSSKYFQNFWFRF